MVTCLSGAKVADIMGCLDRLIDSAGEVSAIMVHLGTSDIEKCCLVVINEKLGYQEES